MQKISEVIGYYKEVTEDLTLLGYMQKSDDSGELKAAKYHLEDMRKLVFK